MSSIFNRLLHDSTAIAPDDHNTTYTQNITSLRFKRDASDTVDSTVGDDVIRTTESTPSTLTPIANEINENSWLNNTHGIDSMAFDSKETKHKSYPRFHVTYWMFYPYSQVYLFYSKRSLHFP